MSPSIKRPKIRLARLDDAAAITDVHVSHVPRWYRRLENETYDVALSSLTVDDRWSFGGPWMSPETCAIHLNSLLLRRCLPLVAEQDGRVVAGMELFIGREGTAYGKNCHIGLLYVHKDYLRQGIGTMLVSRAIGLAREQRCDTLTVACDPGYEEFYRACGFACGDTMASIEVYPEKRPVDIVRLPPSLSAQSFTWGMDMKISRMQSSALHVFEMAEAFALPAFANIVMRVDYLKVAGNDAMIARITHDSGNVWAMAWTRGASAGDLVDAALTVMSAAGARTAYMYLFKKDYDGLTGRIDTRLLGHRKTLLYIL